MADAMDSTQTGTRDETYNIVAILYHALQGVENCKTYESDASGNQELSQFFQQAGQQQRQLADQAKQLLHKQLMQGGEAGQSGGQGSSAFGFSGAQQGAGNMGATSGTGSSGSGM